MVLCGPLWVLCGPLRSFAVFSHTPFVVQASVFLFSTAVLYLSTNSSNINFSVYLLFAVRATLFAIKGINQQIKIIKPNDNKLTKTQLCLSRDEYQPVNPMGAPL